MVELQATDAGPDVVTLPGETDPHDRPAGTLSVIETVPVKPFR
jgi:hypothetical protein